MATADLDSTISALKGGLTSIPPEAAVANIESWQQQVQGAAPELASALGKLKSALTGGTATPESLSQLLAEIGSQTSAAGASTGGAAGSQLQELGKMLTETGASLA